MRESEEIERERYRNERRRFMGTFFCVLSDTSESEFVFSFFKTSNLIFHFRLAVLILIGTLDVVYTYAGIVKLNEDWLRGEPCRYVIHQPGGSSLSLLHLSPLPPLMSPLHLCPFHFSAAPSLAANSNFQTFSCG